MHVLRTFMKRLWGLRDRRHLTSVLLRRLGISRHFKIETDSLRLYFHPAAMASHLWENSGEYGEDRDFLKRYLKPGDIFVDAGANIGLLTLTASRLVLPHGHVVAVEAHPETFRFLSENLSLNHSENVTAHNLALGAAVGSAFFSDDAEDDIRHISTAAASKRLPMTTLDELTRSLPRVHLFKLDVEGYELAVLYGAGRTLAITDCVYFESCDLNLRRYGHRREDLFRHFYWKGFSLYSLTPRAEGRLRPLSESRSPSWVENLLAVRDIPAFLSRTGYRYEP